MTKREFRDMTGEVDEKGRVIYDSEWKGKNLAPTLKEVLELRKTTGEKDVVFKFNGIEIVAGEKDKTRDLEDQYYEGLEANTRESEKKHEALVKATQKKADTMIGKLDEVSGNGPVLKWLKDYTSLVDVTDVKVDTKAIAGKLEAKGYSADDSKKIKGDELLAVSDPDLYAKKVIGSMLSQFEEGKVPNPKRAAVCEQSYRDPEFVKLRHAAMMEHQKRTGR